MIKQTNRPLLMAVVGTFLLQLFLCYFFTFGELIPMTNDLNPSNYWTIQYRFPPQGYFSNLDGWLGFGHDPMPFTPMSVLAWLPLWVFFTVVYPLGAALAVASFYLFLRELKLPSAVAIAGGIIFGWQGRNLSNIYGGHFAPPLMSALFPLAMWAAIRTLRTRSWYWAIITGAATGMVVAIGSDSGMLAVLPVGLLFLAKVGQALWRKSGEAFAVATRLLLTMLVAVLVACSALQMAIGAGITGMKQGGSEDPKEKFAWATQWSWPPEETLTYLVPGYFGWRSGLPNGEYWGRIGQTDNWDQTRQGFRNFSIDTCVIGTIPFLLLGVGIWSICRRTPRPGYGVFVPWTTDQLFHGRLFLGLGAIFFLLSLGKFAPFYWFFYQLPYVNTLRNPMKFLIGPGNFCLIAVAAYGLHAVVELFSNTQLVSYCRKLRRWFLATAVVLALVFLATWFSDGSHAESLRRSGYSPTEIGSIVANQRLTAFVATALVLLTWYVLGMSNKRTGVLMQIYSPSHLSLSAAIFVVTLVVGQMWWVHSHFLEPFEAKRAYQTNPLLETLRSTSDPARVKLIAQDGLLHYYLSAVFPYHGISTFDITAASRIPVDYAQFFQAMERNPLRLWQLAGVKYLIAPTAPARAAISDPLLQDKIAGVQAFQASGNRLDNLTVQSVADPSRSTHLIIQLKDYLPKALFVPGLEILPTTDTEARRLNAPDWNPRQTLLVTEDIAKSADLGEAAILPTSQGTARLVRYEKDYIEVEAQTVSGGYLLINDRFEDSWHAQVNGKDTPVFRANMILRGMRLPPGNSRVVLRFKRPAWAGYVSLAALGLVSLLVLLQRCPCFSTMDLERKGC